MFRNKFRREEVMGWVFGLRNWNIGVVVGRIWVFDILGECFWEWF